MDDPLPFPPLPREPVPGSCSKCGLLADVEALKESISSTVSSRLSTVVARFLSNNYPIPSKTREEIAASLEPNAWLLEKVDEAVIQLSDLLESLKTTREALADRVQRSQFVLHPLRTLPDECLSNIFLRSIAHLEDQDDELVGNALPQILTNNPWALTRVSRHWRDVAINTPKLWSNIVLFITDAAGKTRWEPSKLSAFNLMLTRSATHPLNVIIISVYRFSMNHPLLQGVMAHSQRWRRLHIGIPITAFTFLQQIYHTLPLLEHLFITYSVIDRATLSHDVERIAREWDNFNLAKNLCSIGTHPKTIQDTFTYCPQFANQIKKYRSVFRHPDTLPAPPFPLTPSMHLRALRKLPNLEYWTALCLFENGWPSAKGAMEFEEEGGIVVMNALASICIKETEDYRGAIAQVLDHISAPSLSELTLEGDLGGGCISSVINFMGRSDCIHEIKTLTLIDIGHNRGAVTLIPLLSKLLFLTELGLQYVSLPPPPPAQISLMDDEVDLLSLAEEVLPKGLKTLVLSDETELDDGILEGVKDARPGLKIRMVDKLEVR
jgi:hypothetical protein